MNDCRSDVSPVNNPDSDKNNVKYPISSKFKMQVSHYIFLEENRYPISLKPVERNICVDLQHRIVVIGVVCSYSEIAFDETLYVIKAVFIHCFSRITAVKFKFL